MSTTAFRIRITGLVQGVFFRDWTIDEARALGVTGWVRNRRDGSVEVLAVGESAALQRLIARLHEGSPPSRVDRVEVEKAEPEELSGFARRPTA